MNLGILIILGIIQGFTEFLPVSSSGHLVLIYKFFGIEKSTILLSIIFHLATLMAIIIYYRKDIWALITKPFCKTNFKLLSTTISTLIIYLLIAPIVKKSFNGDYLSIFFTITAIILFLSDLIVNRAKKIDNKNIEVYPYNIRDIPITYSQAIIIGISQAIATFPGISRSGTTIATSRILGCKDNISTKYSFLISIPIILGSLILEIIKGERISNINIFHLSLSFIICLIIGILSIKFMTNFVKKKGLKYFGYYLLVLATILTIFNLFQI